MFLLQCNQGGSKRNEIHNTEAKALERNSAERGENLIMTLLENMWYGNIKPQESFTENDQQYRKMIDLICRNEEKLKNSLSEEQKEMLEKISEAATELNVYLEEKAFRYGFAFAARIMLECFSENKLKIDDHLL